MSKKKEDIEVPLLDVHNYEKKSKPARISKTHFSQFLSTDKPPDKYVTNYSTFSYIAFGDLWKYITKINTTNNQITEEDLPQPFDHYDVESKLVKVDQLWAEQMLRGRPSFMTAVYKAFKSEFYKQGLMMFIVFNGRMFGTIMLGKIIAVITSSNLNQEVDPDELYTYAVYFAIIFLSTNVLNTHYWNYLNLSAARIRLTIVAFVYKKLQSVAVSSLQQLNIGKIINLLANDLNDLDFGYLFLWPLILFPITIVLSGYLLWDYFGFYTLISYSGLAFAVYLSQSISKSTQGPRVEKNTVTDERVKLTNEIIECIRLVKMYAWEKALRKFIETLRAKEFTAMKKLFKIDILGNAVAEMSVYFCAFFMFAIYSLYSGGVLNPEKVYTSIMILTFVKMWCISFSHFGRMFMVGARVMQKRVEDILLIPDIISYEETEEQVFNRDNTAVAVELKERKPSDKEAAFIMLKEFSAFWSVNSQKPCLDNISVKIKPGELVAVIGKIGSGKSSFLYSLLREIPKTEGGFICRGTIAYVEQEPIIFSGTIKSNILFGREYDEELYQQVLNACNLHADLRQLSKGDQTIIGEKGVTLSGGQKARVSLARALYSNSDIYLLDDPLSAVDSRVARHLFTNAIKGKLLKHKIVILVTHHLTYAKEADRTIVFEEGRIVADGPFASIQNKGIDLLNIFKKENEADQQKEGDVTPKARASETRKRSTVHDNAIVEEIEEIVPEFKEEETQVTWDTYKQYLKSLGSITPFLSILGIYIVHQASVIGFSRYMGYWAYVNDLYYAQNGTLEGFDNFFWVSWGFILTLFVFLSHIYARTALVEFIIKINSELHNHMLRNITRAIVSFFDKTPIGSVLNRFSNDLGVLDKNNWQTFHAVIWGSWSLIFLIGTVCIVNPLVLIPSFLVFMGLVWVRNVFTKPSIESKRLDLQSRSPLYSDISATLNGLLVIRVFRQGGRFIRTFLETIYNNLRCYSFMQRVQGVFGLVIDLWLYCLTVSGIFLYIYVASHSSIEPGLFGLALVLLLEMCNASSYIIKQSLQLDVNMQSAARCLKYCELPEEPAEKTYKDEEVKNECPVWPPKGEIQFRSVFMRYGEELGYALNGLTFDIKPGEKVGIVGRTGAGKSSIIQAIFRMVEIEPKSDILIDGVNIRQLGLEFLRKNLSIIPQTAVIFSGTIRRNLDPFNEYTDEQVWKALEEVRLKTYVSSLQKQLDTDMTVSSTIFSAGQKQLICLARAILRKSKIIILDEATANVDIGTDNFIQEQINEKFKDCTVLTIAHRLTTIAHYDKVLVLDRGLVAEYNVPYLLLVNEVGDKTITGTGLFASMVKSAGESMSGRIFDIAYNKYMSTSK